MGLSGTELIEGCLRADAVARAEFVTRFQGNIASVLVKMAFRHGRPSQDLLHELKQEVYLKIFAADCKVLRTLRSCEEPVVAALVQSIAYTVACDYFRKNSALKRGGAQRMVALDDAANAETFAAGDGENPLLSILFSEIDHALGEVADPSRLRQQRSVFWLYFRHGFTARDIAGLPSCGLSEKGVESLLGRLTKSVRERLGSGRAGGKGKSMRFASGGSSEC